MRAFAFITLVCATLLAILLPPQYFFDFSVYWKSVQYLVLGMSPYSLPHYASYVLDYPETLTPEAGTMNIIVMGPPFGLGLIFFFGFLSLGTAKQLFLFLQICAVGLCIGICWRLFAERFYEPGKWHRSALVVALMPWGFWAHAWNWGSPSWMLCVGIFLFLWFQSRGMEFASGVALCLLLFKIHLFVGFFAALGAWIVKEDCWNILAGFLTGLAALVGILLFFNPSIFQLHISLVASGIQFQFTNSSIPSVAALLAWDYRSLIMTVPQLVAGGCLVLLIRRSRPFSIAEVVAFAVPISILFAPYAWGHDYTTCLPAVAIMVARALEAVEHGNRARGIIILILLIVTAILSAAFAFHFYVAGWTFILPAILLGFAAIEFILLIQKAHTEVPRRRGIVGNW